MNASGRFELTADRKTYGSRGFAVLRARGEIDLAVADEFERGLSATAGDGAAVVLDLRSVGFLDSSGLRVILMAAADLGSRLAVLVEPGSPVAGLIDLAEVRDRLSVFSAEDDAVDALASEGHDDSG